MRAFRVPAESTKRKSNALEENNVAAMFSRLEADGLRATKSFIDVLQR